MKSCTSKRCRRSFSNINSISALSLQKWTDGIRGDMAEHLAKINALLRARLGHDFSKYKEKTLVRRIQRRMQVLQIDNVPTFIARLREDPPQLELLFRDLLIGVTQFFRDPDAFAALETEAIPRLLHNKGPDEQVRIWELSTARTQLQSTIDELETANEEMKSASEEYQSVNEELQSSNEELETTKEEMQSVNEEGFARRRRYVLSHAHPAISHDGKCHRWRGDHFCRYQRAR
jgi:septation ring formation regulator EzrA